MNYYRGIKKIYFHKILKTIINIGDLNNPKNITLDFGCGTRELGRLMTNKNYIGYDTISEYSDINDWSKTDFNIFATNEVFYEMKSEEIRGVLAELKKTNPNCALIFGISRQGWMNKLGAFFLQHDALDKTKTPPEEEKKIIGEFCVIRKKKPVLGLSDIYLARFK